LRERVFKSSQRKKQKQNKKERKNKTKQNKKTIYPFMHGFLNFDYGPKMRNERNLLTRLERTSESGASQSRVLRFLSVKGFGFC